ncbi:MAG: hypothetical protein Q8R25_00225 [bacterium]|nr:hypothetical protein [bacterium]
MWRDELVFTTCIGLWAGIEPISPPSVTSHVSLKTDGATAAGLRLTR